ncbi:endonuclease V [Actinoplanes sp. KI2]|uniref:endonuclease V n=1 Tax=Actinoplanes sp. KI2 TaxID=2983315 RepID=UPI0021D573B6|nr:endonuclease V [Actinoplanes sp. KI2]MCU7727636.1 endonuclease V [Actinoplanes sp. KI2]
MTDKRTAVPHRVPADVADAERIQAELRDRLVLPDDPIEPPATVTGLDISYAIGSDRAVAAAVTVEVGSLRVREVATAPGTVHFPYVPGLLAFREIPLLLAALDRLDGRPEVLVCDGYGIAHPRRFGLASHLGVLLDLPAFGVAKNAFVGEHAEPGPSRGEWSALHDGDEVLGRAVRTRTGVKPVYVSAGHRIGLADATALTVRLSTRYRIPEPTRQADIISRQALRQGC